MRRTVGALLAAAALLVVAVPAQAGGPTSVLITDPTTGAATALYYTDSRYAELDRLLQAGEPATDPAGQLGARHYTVSWLVHDIQVWRTHSVYLDARGGPLIATSVEDFETGVAGSPTWIRATEAKAIEALVGNVLEGKGPVLAPAKADPAPPVVEERLVTETAWFSLDGWRWALPGLLAGLIGGVAVAARRRPDAEPRRLLVDGTPEAGLS
ncbi:MAG TPA: hypothetical protein VLI04_15770 [Nocardioidaceae bacterium]|nr:hypothetical protein [Nocardioidaceae bacterium]